jgi:predicted ATPase/class 3 adenylate cyclase
LEGRVEAERRQVTVLFADMVGFTTFSERSGEEAAYTLMRSLSKLMDEAVREQGGFVRGFTGDGIMAVFGAPVAFEDAPLRACRAALNILKRLKAEGPDLEAKHGVRPQMRVGLNTGAAIVGKVEDSAEAGVTVLGDTVNFAARLQSLAEPNSIFISDATHRLVLGLADESFAGEHTIKGKAEPQKVYRLDGIRQGATRFEAAVTRGLTTFVGREHELEVLERALDDARSQLRVIDIVAEPGIGKSRLLHEFRQRVGKERAFILSGGCSPDSQQTPFLPFIEVVRGAFRLGAGEAEKDIGQKLEMGLTALGLQSTRNLGLLLHLLGLKVPDDGLKGLDGVLIGLRTRELLQELLEARCRLSPLLMMIEDLHWIDSASEELFGKIIDSEAKRRLLLVTTRRPEYSPPWLGRAIVTKLPLEPLPTGDIRRLMRERLGVEAVPEGVARQVTEKAEGNPLFVEEIVSYLTERGIIRAVAGELEFDASVASVPLPASVQSLLAARVDRLAPKDRSLLQAASVIGRQFDPVLLAGAVGETDIDDRLVAMQALDLVLPQSKSDDYAFKHALVRDALYQSLLTEPRKSLHLKIAEEIVRRSGNRLTEVAEVLAYHYSQTDRAEEAFIYLAMAGSKCLNVYSLDQASSHFAAALALIDKNPECASDNQVTDFLVPYTLLLNMFQRSKDMIDMVQRHSKRIDHLGDDARVVLIHHHFIYALLWNARYPDAAAVQRASSLMASRLRDTRSRAYSLASEIYVSTLADTPMPLDDYEALKRQILIAVADTSDAYIQCWARFVIGWEEIHRGRMNEARKAAHELMEVGKRLNDPRSTGFGLAVLTWIALTSDSYAEALEYSNQSLMLALAPFERDNATRAKGAALVLLRRPEEGVKLLQEDRRRCVIDGNLYANRHNTGVIGLSEVLAGNVTAGIQLIKRTIEIQERDGCHTAADWYRFYLGEVYLQIITRKEKLSFVRLLSNLPVIIKVIVSASSVIPLWMLGIMANPRIDSEGLHIGRAHLILGLLFKTKTKKRAQALHHLVEAKRILSKFGETPILARAKTALAELRQ